MAKLHLQVDYTSSFAIQNRLLLNLVREIILPSTSSLAIMSGKCLEED